jgi:hypothetical protein
VVFLRWLWFSLWDAVAKKPPASNAKMMTFLPELVKPKDVLLDVR